MRARVNIINNFKTYQYIADYKQFFIDNNETYYKLSIGAYDKITSTIPDSFIDCHDGAKFSTSNMDHDEELSLNIARSLNTG